MTHEPKIYVSTYAKYNNGSLSGKWLTLTEYNNANDFMEACTELHSDEQSPELMFQAYEGFNSAFYSESPDMGILESLFEYLALDDNDRHIVDMYLDATGCGYSRVYIDEIMDAYQGTADSGGEFAERICEEIGYIPKDFPNWIVIDWDATWQNNLRHDYNTATDDDGTMYFFLNI